MAQKHGKSGLAWIALVVGIILVLMSLLSTLASLGDPTFSFNAALMKGGLGTLFILGFAFEGTYTSTDGKKKPWQRVD